MRKQTDNSPINTSNAMKESINESNGSQNIDNMAKESKGSDEKNNIKMLCETMRRQIISRAFYGWLAYCRHLRTVRTHLADLVNTKIISCDEPTHASKGINEELWLSMKSSDGRISDFDEVYRLIYFGGIEHNLRKTVWPYLLGHYGFDMSDDEKSERDKEVYQMYEMLMSRVRTIVRI